MQTRLVLGILAVTALTGCESGEERCNRTRVAAHDAWTAYAPLAEADARAAAVAFDAASEEASATRDAACMQAWTVYKDALGTLPGGSVNFLMALSMMLRAPTPCTVETYWEARAIEANEIPAALVAQRTSAIAAANSAYDAATSALLARRDTTTLRASAVRAALAAATGPAIRARDTSRAVTDDPAHPERAAAKSAAEASWDACQSVAP